MNIHGIIRDELQARHKPAGDDGAVATKIHEENERRALEVLERYRSMFESSIRCAFRMLPVEDLELFERDRNAVATLHLYPMPPNGIAIPVTGGAEFDPRILDVLTSVEGLPAKFFTRVLDDPNFVVVDFDGGGPRQGFDGRSQFLRLRIKHSDESLRQMARDEEDRGRRHGYAHF